MVSTAGQQPLREDDLLLVPAGQFQALCRTALRMSSLPCQSRATALHLCSTTQPPDFLQNGSVCLIDAHRRSNPCFGDPPNVWHSTAQRLSWYLLTPAVYPDLAAAGWIVRRSRGDFRPSCADETARHKISPPLT